jgi:hypothetical protein
LTAQSAPNPRVTEKSPGRSRNGRVTRFVAGSMRACRSDRLATQTAPNADTAPPGERAGLDPRNHVGRGAGGGQREEADQGELRHRLRSPLEG